MEMLLQRNLLYTAITRAKRLAVLVGTQKALRMAIRNNKVEHRFTYLRERIASFNPPAIQSEALP